MPSPITPHSAIITYFKNIIINNNNNYKYNDKNTTNTQNSIPILLSIPIAILITQKTFSATYTFYLGNFIAINSRPVEGNSLPFSDK